MKEILYANSSSISGGISISSISSIIPALPPKFVL